MQGQQAFKALIYFRMPSGSTLACEDSSYLISMDDGTLRIASLEKTPISKATSLLLWMDGFELSAEMLKKKAEQVNHALQLSSLLMGLGVDSRCRPATSFVNTEFLENIATEKGFKCNFCNLNPGINILQNNGKEYVFPRMEGNLERQSNIANFSKLLSFFSSQSIILSENMIAAFEILNSTMWPMSSWAKYVLCVSAIEVMSRSKDEDDKYKKAIEKVIRFAGGNFARNVSERIVEKLKRSKKKSINESCKDEILQYLGKDKASKWKDLYSVRSKIAHGSYHKRQIPIDNSLAYDLAKNLLLAKIMEKNPALKDTLSTYF